MRRLMALALVVAAAVDVIGGQTPAPRTVLLVVDAGHIDFRQTPRLRRLLQDLVKRSRQEDRWVLVTTGSADVHIETTHGVADILPAISRVTGNDLAIREQLNAFGDPDRAAIVRRRMLLADIATGQAISEAAHRSAGPPAIVYLTGGYDARLVPAMSETVHAIAEVRARLIAVSVGDLVPREPASDVRPEEWTAYVDATRASIRTLAEQTGGTPVFSRDDLDAALARLSQP